MLAVESDLRGSFDFVPDVNLRCGIVAHENGGESGTNAASGEFTGFVGEFGADLGADAVAIQNDCGHIGFGAVLLYGIRILSCDASLIVA